MIALLPTSFIFILNIIKESGFNPFSIAEMSIFLVTFSLGLVSFFLLFRERLIASETLIVSATILILISAAFLGFGSQNFSVGFAAYALHVKYLYLLFFMIYFFKNSKKSKIFFLGLYLISIFVIFLGFYRDGFNFLEYFSIYTSERYGGLLNNPNINGVFIFVSWIFSLILFQNKIFKGSLLPFAMNSLLYSLPILMTGSRRAIIIFLLGNFFLIYSRLKLFGKAFTIFISIFLIWFIGLFNPISYERHQHLNVFKSILMYLVILASLL